MSGSSNILLYFPQVYSPFVAVFIIIEVVAMNKIGQPII